MEGPSLAQHILQGVTVGLENTKVGDNANFTIRPTLFPELRVPNPMDMLAKMTGAALESEGRNPHEAQIAVSHRPFDDEYRVRFLVTNRKTISLSVPAFGNNGHSQLRSALMDGYDRAMEEFIEADRIRTEKQLALFKFMRESIRQGLPAEVREAYRTEEKDEC